MAIKQHVQALSLCGITMLGILLIVGSSGTTPVPSKPPRNPPTTHPQWLSRRGNDLAQADAYYRDIGAISTANGVDRRETLSDFKTRNGFVANSNEVSTTYFNEADLHIGRDMHCRRRDSGDVIACYVTNYGPAPFANGAQNPAWPNQQVALDDAIAKRSPFATVAMEAMTIPSFRELDVSENDGCDRNLVVGGIGNPTHPCDIRSDVDTGIDLRPGDSVRITASGAIWAGVILTGTNGPEGWLGHNSNDPKFPLQGDRPYSLIGRFDQGGYFAVGNAPGGIISNNSANTRRLFLRTNDDTPGNGNGAFTAVITRLNAVKFFTYGSNDELIGDKADKLVALDGEGGKATPGLCLACHGGRLEQVAGRTFVNNASFLPFDVQSFGYANTQGFTVGDQQEAMRKLNALVIASNPNESNKNRPIHHFINSLYQAPGGVNGVGNRAGNAVTPSGWQGHDDSYQFVFKPYCQMCHMALDSDKDFVSFQKFQDNKLLIETDSCTAYVMPHAQVPYEKFWKITLPDAPAGLAAIGIANCKPN